MSDSVFDIIDKKDNEQMRSAPAQRLIEKLSLLKNRKESYLKRWFWELLQNASDYNESVSVRLTVNNHSVKFEHDGAPFSVTDVLNIISPDSNKSNDEAHKDNIGKFGSGLVSTHILSSCMEIKGICLTDESESKYHSFSLTLDRSSYVDKNTLIADTATAKEQFKESLQRVDAKGGFNTSITYSIGKTLPDLFPVSCEDINLDYLYSVLPYTLCFMPKVKDVSIIDERHGNSCYSIKRSCTTDDNIDFLVNRNAETTQLHFAYFKKNDVSSVFRYEGNEICAFPANLSKIFCGLPLIGTEDVGLPFLLNSLAFEPTTEREGVELEPGSNEKNRTLFSASTELYKNILEYVEQHKMRNAFYLTKLRQRYNGTQASNTQFYNLYVSQYKKHILSHSIVLNAKGDFVPYSQIYIPFKDSKPDEQLFEYACFLANGKFPIQEDYEKWFTATDFTQFKDQKYTINNLIEAIAAYKDIYSFGKEVTDVKEWLRKSLEYIKNTDRYIFSKHALLPNQSGSFCLNTLKADVNLPQELKTIYNLLFSVKGKKIEDDLLDKSFDFLEVVSQPCRTEDICRMIDCEIAEQYSKSNGNTDALSQPFNMLYSWISKSSEKKEDLASWFRWYYPKRASLIVDMMNEGQREQALIIAKSGKMDALAKLAESNLTTDEIAILTANIKRLPQLLGFLSDNVDDQAHANLKHGDEGEKIVYEDLLHKYPRSKGFKVVWASKDFNEQCFDFEVKRGDDTICYCDAKTTSRGVANADSIPFFMRKSQWEFLQCLSDEIPYFIARVFIGSGGVIKYMRIMKKQEND